MSFWKRPPVHEKRTPGRKDVEMGGRAESYPIHFDMMLKGNFAVRGRKQVRQIGVTVNGSTHLVTSGDVVDRQVYEALIAMGAIAPHGAAPEQPNG